MNCIGLDLGTGTIKGVLWNPADGIIASGKRTVPLLRPQEKFVEINPETYFDTLYSLLAELSGKSDSPIEGIAFAAASGNTLLCDENAVPQTQIISWLDKRIDWMPPEEWNVFAVTGWPCMKAFPLAHLEYFKRTRPELTGKAHFAMNNDWAAWKLTGKHKLDYSNAVTSQLQNVRKKCYEQKYLDYFALTVDRLPELVPTGEVIGCLKEEFCSGNLTKETEVFTGSFDHPAAARGVGVLSPDEMLLSCGTSWVGFQPIPADTQVVKGELFDPFQSGSGKYAAKMFSLAAVGIEIENFIKDHYGNASDAYDRFNDDPEALPLMQSIVDRVTEKIRLASPRRIVMTGGPSEGKAWRRLLLEKLPCIEFSPQQSFAGAVGAAMIAKGVTK